MASPFYDQSKEYKIAMWILGATLLGSTVMVFVATMVYLNAALKLNKQQEIGRRIEEQCGKEVTEMETERYYIYRAVHERKLHKQIASALILVRVVLGLMISAIMVAYGFWTWMIVKGDGKQVLEFKFQKASLQTKTGKIALVLYVITASLLFTGTIGAWIRAADAAVFHNKMRDNGSVNETVTSLLSTLNSKLTKTGGIESPWFPIVLVIAYGVFWAWVTSDSDSTGTRVQKWGAIMWFAILGVYFFAAFLVWVAEKDTRYLFAAVMGSYHARKQELQDAIENLIALNNTKVFTYFKNWIETVSPKTEVAQHELEKDGQYYDQLWKFIQHRSGKEMEELLNNDTLKSFIAAIRTGALQMRMTRQPMNKATRRFCRNAIIAPMVLLVSIFFILFNGLTRMWSSTNMVIASLLIIFALIIVSTGFGWFSSALLL